MNFLTTVTGSYPRKEIQKDTLRKSTVSEKESLEMVQWASKEQANLGLDIITDGEGYRENMYWFYQLRIDGVDAINKKYKHFSKGGSMKGVNMSKTHGTEGFGIECAVVKNEIKNLKTNLAQKWKMARNSVPSNIEVKQTITGPHMLARFSVNERTDLYPDDKALAKAYADALIEELKTVVSTNTRNFTDMLSKMNRKELDVKPAVGFPRTSDDFEKTPKLKKMRKGRRKAKASELEATSNNRFLDQFVGRELKKESSRRVAGAAFEMGLMYAGSDDENSKLKVTLSELGKEFVGLDWTKNTETYNQIFDQIWNPEKRGVTPIKNIFSKLEVDFIMEKIIPRFELEYIIVKEFLGLSQETSVDTITDIFLNKQKLYLEQKGAEAYDKIKEKLEKNPLARATTVMTKLVELGKVKRIKRGLSVFYIANST